MIAPPVPTDEQARLATLRGLGLLDTEAEERFDRVTRLARRLFGVPIALVSLVDAERQWFKSRQGLGASETSREVSFCGHAILEDEPLVVSDARRDVRFKDNPLVVDRPDIRFYAGCPLSANGHKVGTLCLIDEAPRELSPDDLALLQDLARMVEDNLGALDAATSDELTGLSNRRGFDLLSDQVLKKCRRLHQRATVVVFDLDGFKPINDRWGHAEGDRALQDFARCLLDTFRESDVIGRLGGDEFGVFLGGVSSQQLPVCIDRMNEFLDDTGARNARAYQIRYSVGSFSCRPDQDTTLAEMLRRADASMYQDKARSGSRFARPRADIVDRLVERPGDALQVAAAIWGLE